MDLDPHKLKKIVQVALKEDIGKGDITSNSVIPLEMRGLGLIFAQEDGILAGLGVARMVFESIDEEIEFAPKMKDGDRIEKGMVVATVIGSARTCLTGERVALNFLQRLSGIATLTNKFVNAIVGTKAKILDTRKTTRDCENSKNMRSRSAAGLITDLAFTTRCSSRITTFKWRVRLALQ